MNDTFCDVGREPGRITGNFMSGKQSNQAMQVIFGKRKKWPTRIATIILKIDKEWRFVSSFLGLKARAQEEVINGGLGMTLIWS